MKKIFLALTTTVLFSPSGFAGSVQAYRAALKLDCVKSLAFIEKIEVKSTFRCKECYELTVRGLQNQLDTESTEFLVSTHLDTTTNKVVAKVVEP